MDGGGSDGGGVPTVKGLFDQLKREFLQEQSPSRNSSQVPDGGQLELVFPKPMLNRNSLRFVHTQLSARWQGEGTESQ